MDTGINLIAKERQRQIEQEGWTAEHDKEHEDGQLAMAAVCYASPQSIFKHKSLHGGGYLFEDPWPWALEDDKRKWDVIKRDCPIPNEELSLRKRIRNLVKAGALIAAEIDRLNNAKPD